MIAVALAFLAGAAAVTGTAWLAGTRTRGARAGPPRLLAFAGRAAPRSLRPTVDLRAKLDAAGAPAGLRAADVMAAKAGAALLAAAVGPVAATGAPGRLGVALALAAPAAAFFLPDAWLGRRARTRISAARAELPGLLDLLAVAAEAGLSPARALAEVGRHGSGPLAEEWVAVGQQAAVGVRLEAALGRLARRLPAPETAALVAAIARTVRHGAPLGPALAAQAREARAAARRRIEERAARAAPKIQLVVALLLVPSVLLLIAAALVAAFLGGGAGPPPAG